MSKFSTLIRPRALLGALGLALVALLVFSADPAFAQLPDFNQVESQVQTTLKPLFQLIRWLLVGFCLIAGIWEAFKASRGNSKGWLTAVLLWIVGGIAMSPGTVLDLLGLYDLSDQVGEYF